LLTIAGLLAAEDVTRVREALAEVRFRDGKVTAGAQARKVKANSQADRADPRVPALAEFVREAMAANELFRLAARPARWSHLLFSRYAAGDAYGLHTDDATMVAADGGRLRTDLSFTLFLSDPATYEGGELLIDGTDGELLFKPPAGALVLYATGLLHRVMPVTSGERLAAVGWIQSLIRRGDERDILFDLARVRASLPDGEPRLLLDRAAGQLMRLWAEP